LKKKCSFIRNVSRPRQRVIIDRCVYVFRLTTWVMRSM